MKKFLCAGLCMLFLAVVSAGCGTVLEADRSTLYVNNKGAVTSLEVETFEEDYYDAEELEAFVNEAVDAYTAEKNKGAVKVEELSVNDNTAKLRMKYKTTEDYSEFNGIELYQGKVLETLEAGYTYDGDFVKVEDGEITGKATKMDIYKEQGLKAVIIRANMDVKVDGKIHYISSENVSLTGEDSVSIGADKNGAFETEVYNYIIYK